METSNVLSFKERFSRLTENRVLSSGRVLEVRAWPGGQLTEIDLHLPAVDMRQWQDVPYIKFKVDAFTYRDYTPFGWDADTATCSLLIDTSHDGMGSRWARALMTGDQVQYLKIDFTRQSPHPTELVVGLGDSSSLAHLLALQQLTLPKARFWGAAVMRDERQASLFKEYFGSTIHFLGVKEQFTTWLFEQGYCTDHTHFYLTGHNRLVNDWRRTLKAAGHAFVKVKGFWS